jgi:UDP-glucuronate decarboxylase
MNTDRKQPLVIVTGGAGFIGRHLCSHLLEKEENVVVLCIDNLCSGSMNNIEDFMSHSNFLFLKKDVTDLSIQNMIMDICNENHFQITEIYHLACMASPDKYKKYPIETLNTCFMGTQHMLQLAEKNNARILLTSTSEVYGDPLIHPQPEEYYGNVNTVGERSCYDEGKRVAETLVYEYRKHGIDAKIVRIFNTYGPYMDIDDGRVITNFIKQIINGEPLIMYGNGKQTRSFCYVDDMINGLVSMMKSAMHGPINLGNPDCEFTLLELAMKLETIVNMPLQIEFIDATENDPKQRKPDISKARLYLEFNPKIDLIEGVKRTMNYFIDAKR